MIARLLHWALIASQAINMAVLPPGKIQTGLAIGVGVIQYLVHEIDSLSVPKAN